MSTAFNIETRLDLLLSTCLLVLLAGCGQAFMDRLAQPSELPCDFVQDSFGGRVSWNSLRPVTLEISKDWPKEFTQSILRAQRVWNDGSKQNLIHIETSQAASLSVNSIADRRNGIYWLTDWPENQRNTQALTRILFKDSQIYDADIRINARHFLFYEDAPSHDYMIHLPSLMVHEFGHALGLKHKEDKGTVMNPYLTPWFERMTLSKSDLDSVGCEYR